jgi:hypothetical protein
MVPSQGGRLHRYVAVAPVDEESRVLGMIVAIVISTILTVAIYIWLVARFLSGEGGFLPILILPSLSLAFYGYTVLEKRGRLSPATATIAVLVILCLSWLAVLVMRRTCCA